MQVSQACAVSWGVKNWTQKYFQNIVSSKLKDKWNPLILTRQSTRSSSSEFQHARLSARKAYSKECNAMQCNLGRAEAASMAVGQGHERMRDQAKQLTSEAKGITNQGSVNLRLLRSFQPQVQATVSECELSDYIKRCNRRQVYPLNRARVCVLCSFEMSRSRNRSRANLAIKQRK